MSVSTKALCASEGSLRSLGIFLGLFSPAGLMKISRRWYLQNAVKMARTPAGVPDDTALPRLISNKPSGFTRALLHVGFTRALLRLALSILPICCLLGLVTATALAGAPVRKQGYEAFHFVRTRNIFDPKRNADTIVSSDASVSASTAAAQAVQAPTTSADYAALTGIMVTDEKTLAFFSGSRPEFNRVLSVKAVIAGATINKITPAAIEVQRGGKLVTVAVGQTVPLDGSAPGPAPFNPAPSPATEGPTPAPSSDTTAGSSDKEALLKRMMERRQQELK